MLSRQLVTRLTRSQTVVSNVVRSAVSRSPVVYQMSRTASSPVRMISSTAPRLEATPLTAKLQEEIQFEAENADSTGNDSAEPPFLTEFKSEGVWTINDQPGADEIILTRSYGNENIRIIFSISDLDAEAPEADEYIQEGEDAAEGLDATSNADAAGDTTAASSAGGGGPSEDSFPVETSITITKTGTQGALTIDAVAQDGLFTINNISFYNDAELATGMSSEDDWKRQGLYMGPAFDNLDEGVQTEFENFLEERGINSSLALFIPDLAEYKEQKEYVQWLKSVNGFLQA